MYKFLAALAIIAVALFTLPSKAAEPIADMAVLAPYAGVWQEVKTDGAKGQPDVQKWEWAFKGKVMRILHGSGHYGGESLIHWDTSQAKILFRYVTNDGFYTDGIMTPTVDGIDVHETIKGAKGGPSEVISHYSITKTGEMQIQAKFKMNGAWGEGFTSLYKRTPTAVVTYDN